MKYFPIIFFSLISSICFAQNVSLNWVKTYGGPSTESAKIIKTDSDGNLFVIGNFMDTVDFDPGPGIENKISNGGNDVYILKLNSAGNFLWVRTFGNSANDIVEKAQVDKLNNIILTGRFSASLDFDPSLNVDIKTSNGFSDTYILKLNNLGNYLWSKTVGGTGNDVSRGLSINSTNDVTIAGNFFQTVDFDPGPAVVNKTAPSVNIYILQLNEAGNFNWVKVLEGPVANSVQVNDLMFDNNDNLLLNASYKDSIDVDPGPGTQYLLDTNDPLQYNLFILKLDANGNYVWAKQFDNAVGNTAGISVLSFDSVGNYYLGGLFVGNVDFDFSASVYSYTTPKSASYILKIDSNANFIWAKHMGGFSGNWPEIEAVLGIAIDSQSNVSLCGIFKGYEDFDPGPSMYYLGNPNQLINSRGYIMQLDSTGNFKWAKNISDQPASASVNSILLDYWGDIYVAGDFTNNTDFDFNLGVYNVLSQGDGDAFVLKIQHCTNSNSIDVINSCNPYTWIDGNTYTASNFTASDTLINGSGCDSIVTLNLTITTINTSINQTGNTLTANANGATYQWLDCSNNFMPLVGETNQSFTPLLNGSYAVSISNGPCKDTSTCYSFTTLWLEPMMSNTIAIFPNPSYGQLSIRTDKQLTLRLYNYIGQLMLIEEITNTQTTNTIELNKLAKGLYLYELSDQSHIAARGKINLL